MSILHTLPDPPIGADTDVRELDGFMLNVERLMASELVALSSHEVIAAALFLWCRAWKQMPAASLPDDERVLAAFSRLPLPRFRKLRGEVMRGFVKCSDGRWYHGVLAVEAEKAFGKKQSFHNKRQTDAERLRNWRNAQRETHHETPRETQDETRFVAEGQGQGQERDRKGTGTGKGQGQVRKAVNPSRRLPEAEKPNPENLGSAAPNPAGKKLPAIAGELLPEDDPSDEAEITSEQRACRATWDAFAEAYRDRYGCQPVRNAKVNAAIKGFTRRIGADESPGVARYYLSHSDAFYARKCHDAGLLLADAEKLRTEWATQRQVTGVTARQQERTGTMRSAVERICAEREAAA